MTRRLLLALMGVLTCRAKPQQIESLQVGSASVATVRLENAVLITVVCDGVVASWEV